MRKSNTEPLSRLNVEGRGGVVDLEALVGAVNEVIQREACHFTARG